MKNLKKQVFKKAIEFGFKEFAERVEFELPLGFNSKIIISSDLVFKILQIDVFEGQNDIKMVKVRKIESVKDFELLFNAVCPKKFMLPF